MMKRRANSVAGVTALVMLLACGSARALEDEAIAPTRLAKSYLELNGEYGEYKRDQIVRATGEKGGKSSSESTHLGISGFLPIGDRVDLRASAYRREIDSTSEWRGEGHSRKDTDNSNFDAAMRYKFISAAAGGLSGTLGGHYNDGERHGYYAELAPYLNLSRAMTGRVVVGYGSNKTDSDLSNQKRQYINAYLHWKPAHNFVISPRIGYTYYESRDVFSSWHATSLGVSARYDIDARWSLAPSISYTHLSKLENDRYSNDLGSGHTYSLFLGLRRHFDN